MIQEKYSRSKKIIHLRKSVVLIQEFFCTNNFSNNFSLQVNFFFSVWLVWALQKINFLSKLFVPVLRTSKTAFHPEIILGISLVSMYIKLKHCWNYQNSDIVKLSFEIEFYFIHPRDQYGTKYYFPWCTNPSAVRFGNMLNLQRHIGQINWSRRQRGSTLMLRFRCPIAISNVIEFASQIPVSNVQLYT